MRWTLKRNFLKPFIFFYIMSCYAIFLGITTIYYDKVAAKEEQMRSDQKRAIALREVSLMDDFSIPFADARILADIISLKLPGDIGNSSNVVRELVSFASNRGSYGQVRLLDTEGVEVVRINRDKNGVHIVPKDQLQTKAHRDYFINSKRLGSGEVYVSPLDLNIEQHAVEVPYVPVIRFTSPVVSDDGKRHGLVVLNFYAAEMLEYFRDAAREHLSDAMLLNNQGYWLVADNKDRCWGFMFEGNDKVTFQTTYPEVWERIGEFPTGQTLNKDGLFTWRTVSTAFSVSYRVGKESYSYPPVAISPYHWVIVQHVSSEKMAALSDELYDSSFWATIILCAIAGTVLWFTLHSIQRSQEHREELEVLAHHDGLTGLANLQHLLRKLEEACERAHETNEACCLVYIDLDDFKFVNDRYGHEAGNVVLRHVADVLKRSVRATDVVARIGGDEYVILLANIPNLETAHTIASTILKAFEEPVQLECGSRVYVKSSIGIAEWTEDVTDADDLMKRADIAMYDSKNEGKNRISCYMSEKGKIAV